MQLLQPSKFFSVRTHSIGMHACGYVAIFSNTEKFRCLYSHYGSRMSSSPKEYISPLGLGMDQSNPPVVGELERETSVVRRLDGDDIGAEVRSQEQAERLDGVGSFGLSSGETQLRELLVRLQHHHVRAKDHASLLLLVVVYLDSGVVRDSERDHLGLVTLDGSSGGTSWVGVGGEGGHYLQVLRWRGVYSSLLYCRQISICSSNLQMG